MFFLIDFLAFLFFFFLGLIGFGLFYVGLVSSYCFFDEQMKCFEVDVDVLTIQMSEVLIFSA